MHTITRSFGISSLLICMGILWAKTALPGTPTTTSPLLKGHHSLSLGDSIAAFAKTLEGLPYRPGGCTIQQGFDCSGLVKYTYDQFDIKLGRSSRDQANAGHAIDADAAQPGDIIVFARSPKGRIFHAGLVLSNSPDSLIMLHANARNGVHRTNLTSSMYWGPKMVDVRRVERTMRP